MSLLDEVSIVVTPNGYKAGELYAVVPVPTEGADLVTDGDFPLPNVNWTIGVFTIADNKLHCVSDGTYAYAVQSNVFEVDKRYKVTFDITSWTSGAIRVRPSGQSPFTSIDDNGSYTLYITATNTQLAIERNSACDMYLENLSVKEYTSADMDVTRATAATRVDENGLVNYAEVIGGEEVTNGDFSGGSTGWTTSGGWSITDKATNSGSGGQIYPVSNSWVSGSTVRFLVTVSNRTTGHIRIQNPAVSVYYQNNINTNDSFIFEFTTVDSAGWKIEAVSGFDGSIDNVSVKEVTRDNVPRIDYTGGGCPHILAEPMRTNNLESTQDFTDTFWNTSNMETIVASTVLSPDGTTFGFKAIPNNTTNKHYVDYDFGFLSMPSGIEVTYSVFVKPFGYTNFQLASSTSLPGRHQNFELTGDGVIGTGDVNSATIEKIGDWYRCSITETTTGTTPRVLNIATPSSGLGRNPTWLGNGTDGVLLWGAQMEEGTYPTSYIPNLSTTSGSTVTRNQDIFTRDGIGSLINSTEGVLFVEMAATSFSSNFDVITLSDGTNNNIVGVFYYANTKLINVNIKDGGVSVFSGSVSEITYPPLDFHKIAVKYKTGDFALWIDGTEVLTGSGVMTNLGLSNLHLADWDGTSNNFFGKVKQLQVYDTALTDEQLLQLTGESGTDFYESYAEMASALTYTIQ